MSRASAKHHRVCDSTLFTEPVIGFVGQISHTPLSEKLRSYTFGRGFVGHVLGAILAKLNMRSVTIRFRPGTTWTIKTIFLV